jgi:hypothetical protein
VSKKPDKSTKQRSQGSPDYRAWRAEIEAFCRQTIAHLQECIEAVESAEQEQRAMQSARPSQQTTSRPTSVPPPTAAGGDLDTSQDRLANLKRELAAKLSKAKREQK